MSSRSTTSSLPTITFFTFWRISSIVFKYSIMNLPESWDDICAFLHTQTYYTMSPVKVHDFFWISPAKIRELFLYFPSEKKRRSARIPENKPTHSIIWRISVLPFPRCRKAGYVPARGTCSLAPVVQSATAAGFGHRKREHICPPLASGYFFILSCL